MSRKKHWYGKDDISSEEFEELLIGEDESMKTKARYDIDRVDRLKQEE